LWTLIGISIAFGAGWRENVQQPPLRLSIGAAEGSWWVQGKLVTLREDDTGLSLELVAPAGKPPRLPELPANIQIEYVEGKQILSGPPVIQVPGEGCIYQLPGQRTLVVGDMYVVSFGRDKVHIFKRPADLDRERLKQYLRKQHAKPLHAPDGEQRPPRDRLRDRFKEPQPPEHRQPPPRGGPPG
jgi:hypothetical protein